MQSAKLSSLPDCSVSQPNPNPIVYDFAVAVTAFGQLRNENYHGHVVTTPEHENGSGLNRIVLFWKSWGAWS